MPPTALAASTVLHLATSMAGSKSGWLLVAYHRFWKSLEDFFEGRCSASLLSFSSSFFQDILFLTVSSIMCAFLLWSLLDLLFQIRLFLHTLVIYLLELFDGFTQ